MSTDVTDWANYVPAPKEPLELDAESLAAVQALQAGETQDSTQHLFETFEPQLTSFFRRNSCRSDEAEDLAQAVFIRMLDQIETLKEPEKFHFWLFKMARRQLINFARDRGRQEDGLADFTDKVSKDSEPDTFWVRGTFEPNPETQLAMSRTVDRRRNVLRKLLKASRLRPLTCRSLLLRLRGACYREIAAELEISASTVGSHISRASTALLRNLENIDLDAIALDDDDAALVAELTPELLTFKQEATEADPAYFSAGAFECASSELERVEEIELATIDLLDDVGAEDEIEEEASEMAEYVVPADIAEALRQDQRRGRRRRAPTRTIPAAGERDLEPTLRPLSRDGLGFPLILLREAADRYGRSRSDPLALKAKLTCAGSLLARGRRFAVARRAEENVQQAIRLIGGGRLAGAGREVTEGRSLLESYLSRS